MDDVELSDLVKQFQALQRKEIPNQVSERNVVEIVNVLLKKGMVELLYTTDAKEYLTWEELRREVVDEVLASNGRLNVLDLPGLLSVHTIQIERILPEVLEDPEIRLEGGELMTDQYLQSTVQMAAEILKEKGTLSIAEFAATHRFTSAFAQHLLTEAVQNGGLSAVLQDAALYTKHFVSSQKAILRAGLLAARQPVDVSQLCKRNHLFLPLLPALIEQVRSEVPGEIEGTRYTPHVYERERSEQIHNVYTSNDVVGYATLQAQGLAKAKQYLCARYNPEGAEGEESSALGATPATSQRRGGKKKSGGRTASFRKPLEGAIRACAQYPLCGHPLSTCFLADRYLSNRLLLHWVLEGEVLALDIAEQLPPQVDVQKDWPLLERRLHELYPALAECVVVDHTVLVRKDAKEKARTALLAALKGNSSQASRERKGKPLEEVVMEVLAEVLGLPRQKYESALGDLAELWSDMVAEVHEAVATAASGSAAAQVKRTRTSLQESMGATWLQLWVATKGTQWVKAQLEDSVYLAVCRQLLASQGYMLSRDVLLNESLDMPPLHAKVTAALETTSNVAGLSKVLLQFPVATQEALKGITGSVTGSSLHIFMETLQGLSCDGTIAVSSFYAPNKKLERECYANLKENVKEEILRSAFSKDAIANSLLFATLCSYLTHLLFHVHLVIPGKVVSKVVARIMQEPGAPASLVRAQEIIVASLEQSMVKDEHVPVLEMLREDVLAM